MVLGSTNIDLADYAVPNKYLKNFTLEETSNGIGQGSFIVVEIRTFDAESKTDQGSRGMPSSGSKV